LLTFACINSSDVFLLLKVKEAGLDDPSLIGVYIFYNLIYALAAYPVGRLSDRIGFKNTFIIGLFMFALVYTGMAMADQLYLFFILFFLYGLYAAATESVAKAWISNITDKKDTATAIGTYTGFQSVCTMAASALAGWIWFAYGAEAIFLFSGITTLLIIVYVALIIPKSTTH
jgi:MFS family permease